MNLTEYIKVGKNFEIGSNCCFLKQFQDWLHRVSCGVPSHPQSWRVYAVYMTSIHATLGRLSFLVYLNLHNQKDLRNYIKIHYGKLSNFMPPNMLTEVLSFKKYFLVYDSNLGLIQQTTRNILALHFRTWQYNVYDFCLHIMLHIMAL